MPFSNLKSYHGTSLQAKDLYKKTLVHLLLRGKSFQKEENKKVGSWTSDHKFTVCCFLLQNEQATPPLPPQSVHSPPTLFLPSF